MATAREESGAGSVFGHKVSAYLMARLASRQSYASFCNATIIELSLQGSWKTVPFDDQVITVHDGLKRRRHLLQCKIRLVAQPSNATFQDVLSRVYAALISKLGIEDDDLFVIVCQECSKANDLGNLFRFASGSTSLQELREKLTMENSELHKHLDTIIDTLKRCIGQDLLVADSELDEVVVHSMVRRLRLWKCDLGNEGSNDRRHAERGLLAFCGSNLQTTQALYERYQSAASDDEARRATFTWSSLRDQYGALEEPFEPSAFELGMSSEAVAMFEGEVDLLIHESLTRTFESCVSLRQVLEERSELLIQAMSSSTAEAAQFIQVCGKATRTVAMSLLKMNASHRKLREWLPSCEGIASLFAPIWTPIARVAIELGDTDLLLKAKQAIRDSDELRFVGGLSLMYEGKQEEAKAHFEQVEGSLRCDALLNLASIAAELEPSEAGHEKALVLMDEAVSLKPDSIVLKLIRANHLQAKYLPYVSSIYLPNHASSLNVQEDLSAAMNTLDSVMENIALGSFERFLTARIRIQLFGLLPTIPALIPSSIDEVLALVDLQSSEARRQAAMLLANVGEYEVASRILEDMEENGDLDDNATETARLIQNLLGNRDQSIVLPTVDNTSMDGMSMIRQGFFATVNTEPQVASALLSEATSSSLDCSFIPEMRLVARVASGDINLAQEDFIDLTRRFPLAIGTWCSLFAWLEVRCDLLRREQGSADILVGSLGLALQVAQLVCDLLPIDSHYAKWIQFAACEAQSKTLVLDLIANHAVAKSNRWATALARALACEDRKDFANAATLFDTAFEEGGLSPDVRVLRDQCKWFARRFDDLAAGVDDLLAEKRRHPGHVQPTINALRELKRDAIAMKVADQNMLDFPDSEIAHWIAFHTAKELGLEEVWGPLLESYAKTYPDAGRVRRIEVDDSGEEILSIIESQREFQELWQERYWRCEIPLKLLPGRLALNFQRQSELLVGLQTTRTGFGLGVATPAELKQELILDITTVLTLSKFGLWEQVLGSNLKLVVPDFVDYELRAETRLLEIEQDTQIEARLDRITMLLKHSTVRTCYQITDESDNPVHGLTYLQADKLLVEKHGLLSVGDRDPDGTPLPDILLVAQTTGRMTSADYLNLPAELRAVTNPARLDAFPQKLLVDDHCVEILAKLSNAADIIDLFDEVWVGPSALYGLSLQLGRVEPDRASRKLMQRVVLDLDKHLGKSTIQIQSTTNGKLDEVDYLKAICALAAETGWAVWADDMATRRHLTSHDPVCPSVSTLELLVHLCQYELMDKADAELHVLELVEGGHRDPFWPDLLRWRRELPVSDKYRKAYVNRLAWQVRENHLNLEEKKLYFNLLKQNLASSLVDSVDDFLSFFEIALQALDGDANELIDTMLANLQLADRQDANDIALRLAKTAQRLGKFSLRGWSWQRMNEFRSLGVEALNVSHFSESVEFGYCFAHYSRMLKVAKQRIESSRAGEDGTHL